MDNIAFFIPKLNGGGAERVFVNLANEFAKKHDLQVYLFVSRKGGEYDREVSNNVNFISLGETSLAKTFLPLKKAIKAYSITHLVCGMTFSNLIGIIQKIFSCHLHVTVVEHNDLSVQLKERSGSWRKKLTPLIIKYTYHYADRVICVSKGVLEFTLSYNTKLVNKAITIYNPIFSPVLVDKSYEKIEDVRFILGELTLITVARLNRQKNLKLFIDTCKELIERGIKLKAYILGQGNESASLQQYINTLNITDSVTLLGFKSNPYKYIRSSDVFLLTSKWEGFGNVLVESVSCGTSIVSVNCPSGPSEVITFLKSGELVNSFNPNDLADAVVNSKKTKFFVSNEKLREFSIVNISKKYMNAILDK